MRKFTFHYFVGSGAAYGNLCVSEPESLFSVNECGNIDNVQSLLTCVAVSNEKYSGVQLRWSAYYISTI